jgi:hypothetical protein
MMLVFALKVGTDDHAQWRGRKAALSPRRALGPTAATDGSELKVRNAAPYANSQKSAHTCRCPF